MAEDPAAYRTLSREYGPVQLKERRSRFLGFAFPVRSREEADTRLAELRQAYPDATHVCHAFRIGRDQPEIRIQDDGEPPHSAGDHIYGQIESFELYDVIVCVVRYYGGTKLGVGGLIQAYRGTARLCLESAPIVLRKPAIGVRLEFSYESLDSVLRLIDQKQLRVVLRQMELTCRIDLKIPLSEQQEVVAAFRAIPGVKISLFPDAG